MPLHLQSTSKGSGRSAVDNLALSSTQGTLSRFPITKRPPKSEFDISCFAHHLLQNLHVFSVLLSLRPAEFLAMPSQQRQTLWQEKPLIKVKFYDFSFPHMCSRKSCFRMVYPRKGDGRVHTLCDKHRLEVTAAASKMFRKWWNRSTLKNTDPQPASRTGVVMQEVHQDRPPKSGKEANEDARQRRIKVYQEHQRQMKEVAAAKERRRGREHTSAMATQVRVHCLAGGFQNRVDIFNPM